MKKQTESNFEDLIRYEFQRSRCTYGSPRIAQKLNEIRYVCSKSTVARYMSKFGIVARRKRKYKITTDLNHGYVILPNILNSQFDQEVPGKIWLVTSHTSV